VFDVGRFYPVCILKSMRYDILDQLRGCAVFGVRLESKIRAWFPCENSARLPSSRVKHCELPEPALTSATARIQAISEMYRGRPSMA
jgi:hypothetical protein